MPAPDQPHENSATPFATVERIGESRGYVPSSLEALEGKIEKPLVPAVRALYLKGIQTTESGANPQTNTDTGFITINYDTLSTENQGIAQQLAAVQATDNAGYLRLEQSGDGYTTASIHIPLGPDDTVESIADRSVAVTEPFVPQPLSWAGYTLEALKNLYAYDSLEEAQEDIGQMDVFASQDGLYYGSAEQAQLADQLWNAAHTDKQAGSPNE